MTEMKHGVLRHGLERYADEGQQIGGGDGAALFVGVRTMLDRGVDGDDEEATRKAEEGEQHENTDEVETRQGQQRGHDCYRGDAWQNHAVFDFVAGRQARDKAADADAQAEAGKQIAAVDFVNVQDVRGVQDDVQQQQGTKKPEKGVGDDRGEKGAVFAHVIYFVK